MPSWVVTGASRGLGYGWISYLASIPENTVVAIVRDKSATESRLTKDDIHTVHVIAADITDVKALSVAATETGDITKGGGLDYLIHNAAMVTGRSELHTTAENRLASRRRPYGVL